MEIPLLTDIAIILGLSIGILFVFLRLKMPALIGFFLTGILAGPHGLGLVKAVHEVEALAEIGVVLLLFTIGIEFSLNQLLQIRKSVLLGGSLQVLLTTGAIFLAARWFGLGVGQSVFLGFLFSLSSTAIVLKLLQERADVDSPHGRTTLGILIFQDIVIVPMMLLTPLLGGGEGNPGPAILLMLVKGAGVIAFVYTTTKWVVPFLLFHIVGTKSRELFLFGVLGICLGVAWLTSSIGLSLSLGAFLAGLIISESEYNHQALGNVLPFKDIFSGFFFVSIGMLLEVRFLIDHIMGVLLLVAAIIVWKTILAALAAGSLGFPLRTTLLVGLGLCQVGEFSFVLAEMGGRFGLLSGSQYQTFLAVSILTMAATPFLVPLSPRVADAWLRLPGLRRFQGRILPDQGIQLPSLNDHLIIVGFGLNGRNLARAARGGQIPYLILEMNPETVREEREKGEPIFFGDATQEPVLEMAGLERARVLVVVINDAAAVRRITETARRLNAKIYLLVRTRFLQEVEALYALGADEVIPEEFETAVEIFTRVLQKYLFPKDHIEKFTAEVRAEGYQMFRRPEVPPPSLYDLSLHIPDMEVTTFLIKEGSWAEGKSLAEMELRKKYGVTVMAVRHRGHTQPNPEGGTRLAAPDLVVIMGHPERLIDLEVLLEKGPKSVWPGSGTGAIT
jgi:CPA2 family monovalent cation:H+ antiporter-2